MKRLIIIIMTLLFIGCASYPKRSDFKDQNQYEMAMVRTQKQKEGLEKTFKALLKIAELLGPGLGSKYIWGMGGGLL